MRFVSGEQLRCGWLDAKSLKYAAKRVVRQCESIGVVKRSNFVDPLRQMRKWCL